MTSKLTPTHTLGDLVTANPALASILDRLGLDYCCGGRRRLIDAIDDAGLDLDEVLDALCACAGGRDEANWTTMSASELVDHLETTHHAYLGEALPRLDGLVDKVTTVHGANHPELAEVRRLFRALRADLEPHLEREERVLFPMIRELATATEAPSSHCGSIANPIRVMLAEHDVAGDLLARIRAVTEDYTVPDDGCFSYHTLYTGLAHLEGDTHLHVHKENNLLFPAVLAIEGALAGRTS